MKLAHLGYYKADYPSLGLSDVDPGAEVELTDVDKARTVMVEGVFAPADAESRKLLIDALTDAEVARVAEEAAREQQLADANAAAQAEAEKVAAEQAARLVAAQADIEAARAAATKAAKEAVKKAAGKSGE